MVIYRHKDKYSISNMCGFFDVSRSGYYDYVKRMNSPAWDLPLAEKIRECQERSHSTYGYRRVHIWLERQGIHKNPKTVLRVMRKYNLLSVVRRKKYRNYGEYLHRYPNLLNRDLSRRMSQSEMGDGYLIHQDRARCTISFGHSRPLFLNPQNRMYLSRENPHL